MIKHLRKILYLSLTTTVILLICFSLFEPVTLAAVSATDTVVITLTVNQQIAISSPADSSMSTSLGITQNTAVGTTTWNVKTNDGAGYTMAVKATTSPAMQSVTYTNTISDYQTGSPNLWSATSGAAYFGYSAYGSDTATTTWGTGSVCSGASAHAISTTLKYQGFQTSNGTNIASRSATTTGAGIDTNVCYAVEQNNYYIAADTYNATIIATATGN